MTYTTRPEVLQMLGGALKLVPKSVFIEKKLASNSVALPIPDILKQILSQSMGGEPNLAAMFQNPIGAISSQLNSAATSAIAQVTTAMGTNAFTSALGNLQSAVTSLSGLAETLSGAASPTGFLNMVAHANMASALEGAIPPELGLDKVIQPLLHGDALGAIQGVVTTLTAQVIASPGTVSTAAATITGHVTDLTAVATASTTASSGMLDVVELASAVQAAATSVIGSTSAVSGNPLLATAMRQIVPPDMLATLDALNETLFPAIPDTSSKEPVQ